MQPITDLIIQEINSFKGVINISETQTFDHYDTVQKINNYRNDKFHKNTEEDAIFWNLAKARLPYFLKKLRLKQKNFKMYGKGENNIYQSWIVNMRFQKWARDSGFTLDLEDLKENCAIFGTVVMKLVGKEDARSLDDKNIEKYDLEPCYFTNLFYDTSTEDIVDSTIIELHEMTELQLRGKTGVWNNEGDDTIDKAILVAEKVAGTSADNVLTKYRIYERWGEYKENQDDMKEKPKYMQYFVCGDGKEEVVLYKKEKKKEDCPFYDFHLTAYEGRHLRVGVYERLFNLQKRANRLVNENAEASKIASLLLLASKESDLVGVNLLQKAQSGQVLDTQDLKQIGIDNRTFSNFVSEMMLIEKQADLLCMTPEVSTGNLPSDATVRGQILTTNEITSAFNPAVDRLGFRICKLLLTKIMPGIVAEWSKEDIVEISEDEYDIRLYDYYAVKHLLNKWLENQFAQGNNPTEEQQKAFMQAQKDRFNVEGRRLTKMKGFFNFKYGFYINPTGADESKERKNEAYQAYFAIKAGNPAAVNDPVMRQFLEDNNISPFRLSQEEINEYSQTQQKAPALQGGKKDALLGQVKE